MRKPIPEFLHLHIPSPSCPTRCPALRETSSTCHRFKQLARQNMVRRPSVLCNLYPTQLHEVSRSANSTIFHDTYMSCYPAKMQIGVCDVMGELPVEPAFAFQNTAKSSKPFDYDPGLLHVIIVASPKGPSLIIMYLPQTCTIITLTQNPST